MVKSNWRNFLRDLGVPVAIGLFLYAIYSGKIEYFIGGVVLLGMSLYINYLNNKI